MLLTSSVLEIKSVQSLWDWLEFKNPFFSVCMEDTTAIAAVVSDPKFLTEVVQGKDISNAMRVKIHRRVTKISFISHCKRSLVAMGQNRMLGWADVLDMVRVSKKANS